MRQTPAGIYLIRTPIRDSAGMTYGGAMRMKIGRGRVAYAAFVTVELAQIACEYWSVRSERVIETWDEAIRHDSVAARLPRVVLFQDEADLRAWLQNPGHFDLAAHTVSLHFGSLGALPREQI